MSKKTPADKAGEMIQKEIEKLQAQMNKEIQEALNSQQVDVPNARTIAGLITIADAMADRLDTHARLVETQTGFPSEADEEILSAYEEFKNSLPDSFR